MVRISNPILLPSAITSILLIIAVFPIEQYGYYIILRWVVCIFAIYVGYFSYQNKKYQWVWLMGIVAILFNPIEPIYFSKGIWQVIDLAVAGIFGITPYFCRKK